jgi:hypothetical protein
MSIRSLVVATAAAASMVLVSPAAGAVGVPVAVPSLAFAHMSTSTSTGALPRLTVQSLVNTGTLNYCVYPNDGPGSMPTCTGLSGRLTVTGMVATGLDPANGNLCGFIGANPAPLPSQGFCTTTFGTATFVGTDGTHLTFADCGDVTGLAGSFPAVWYNNGPEWDGGGVCIGFAGGNMTTIDFGLLGVGTNLLANPFVAIGSPAGGIERSLVFLGV